MHDTMQQQPTTPGTHGDDAKWFTTQENQAMDALTTATGSTGGERRRIQEEEFFGTCGLSATTQRRRPRRVRELGRALTNKPSKSFLFLLLCILLFSGSCQCINSACVRERGSRRSRGRGRRVQAGRTIRLDWEPKRNEVYDGRARSRGNPVSAQFSRVLSPRSG